MAYVYFPARETNFFPPGPPYLAGLRGMRGLGDYAADLAAYQADLKKWKPESLTYRNAIAFNAAKIKVIDADYAAALTAYNADKAKWDKEYAAYLVAAASWNAAFASAREANTTRSQTIAKSYGLSLNNSYYLAGACITQSDHNTYARDCVVVKGLGYLRGLGSTNSDCGMKQLPVCNFGPQPTVRTKPTPPTRAAYPVAPKPLRAMPVAPTAPVVTVVTTPVTTPVVTTTSTPNPVPVSLPVPVPEAALTPEVVDEPKQANVLMGGLIVAAVLGGGYLIYRTLKKPKAA